MPGEFLEVKPRGFNPISASGLTNEAREGVNATLKAMSAWRNEIADTNEKNGKRVIEKMAAAAATLGWPEQVVDAARTQLQGIAELQTKTMDHMMDAWEEQFKLPSAEAFQKGGHEPLPALDAARGSVAETVDRPSFVLRPNAHCRASEIE